MEVFLVLVGIGIIWICIYFIKKNKSEESETVEKPEAIEKPKAVKKSDAIDKSKLKSTIPGMEKTIIPVSEPVRKNHQISLDRLYAKSHDMWVCSHCESLNGNADRRCAACGSKRIV